jgi:hypothetical protein
MVCNNIMVHPVACVQRVTPEQLNDLSQRRHAPTTAESLKLWHLMCPQMDHGETRVLIRSLKCQVL